MKAVVLELRDGYAAVLREDGTVEKIRRDCRVGETIELEERSNVVRFPRKATKWVAAAAAAVALMSAGGTYGFNNAYAYSYVTLDANPSIEYVLNRKNQVIAVQALNEDGTELAEELSGVKRRSLTEAMEATTDILYAMDYLSGEDDSVLVNVTSRGEAQQTALTEEVNAYFGGRETDGGDLTVYVTNATRSDMKKAGELGMSAGRYMLLRDAQQQQTAPDADHFREEPVGRLLEETGRRPAAAPEGEDMTPEAPGAPGKPEESAPALMSGTEAGTAPADRPSEEPAEQVPQDGTAGNGPENSEGGPSGEPSR